MLKQTEGSHAVAEAIALCRPQVICAYPITPQTHIVEGLGEMVKAGELANCEFINVESEFAALSVAIGASAAGVRTYTATSSQGLLFMAEAVYNAAGLGLPIVMTIGNRAIGAPINIWNDHSDSMSMRDAGWIQLYAETNQEALDLHIQAFRLAEELSCPVMVCMDGFILTHAYDRVDVPAQKEVDAFLPRYEPRQILDPSDPVSIGAMVGPEAFMEVRYLSHHKQLRALTLIPQLAAEFEKPSTRCVARECGSARYRSARSGRSRWRRCARHCAPRSGSSCWRSASPSGWEASFPTAYARRCRESCSTATRLSPASAGARSRGPPCGACSRTHSATSSNR
jgi:pyruvate ferredoxin oxidoreductase alpha subunit